MPTPLDKAFQCCQMLPKKILLSNLLVVFNSCVSAVDNRIVRVFLDISFFFFLIFFYSIISLYFLFFYCDMDPCGLMQIN